jgi:signal peptidase II
VKASPTLRAALLAAAVIVADQATKALVRSNIARGDEDPIFPAVTLVNTRNRGVAFGALADGGILVAAVAGAAIVALLVFFAVNRTKRPLAWLPTGLLLGGAAGNLIDRAREGAVTDFIKLPAWPAFNLADVAITVGVLALVYVLEDPHRRR